MDITLLSRIYELGIISIIEIFLFYKSAMLFFDSVKEKKWHCFFLMCVYIIVLIKTVSEWKGIFGNVNMVYIVYQFLVYAIYLNFCYTGKTFKKLIFVMGYFIMIIMVELVGAFIMFMINDTTIDRLLQREIENSEAATICLILKVCIYILIYRKIHKNDRFNILKELSGVIICIFMSLLLGCAMLYVFWLNKSFMNDEVIFMVLLSMLSLIAIVAMISIQKMIKMFREAYQRSMHLNYMEAQQENTKNMEAVVNKLRQLRHDMNNHLGMIYGLCDTEQYELLKRYLEDIKKELQEANDMIVLPDNPGLAIVLNNKYILARQKDIFIEYSMHKVEGMDNKLPLSEVEICAIFGNLLDNAIEACEKIEDIHDRWIDLSIKRSQLGWEIICQNSYAYMPKIINGQLLTNKEDFANHGIGTKTMKQIVENKDGNIIYSVSEDKFLVKISF